MNVFVHSFVKMAHHDSALRRVFYNTKNPALFGTKSKLRAELNSSQATSTISTPKIREWLNYQDVVTLHKTPTNNFPRNHYIVPGIDHLWEIDLCDMQSIQSQNDSYRYILSVIDVFSKFGWMVPIKNKTALAITKAFHHVISTSGRKPKAVQSDSGTEFKNATFRNFLSHNGIKQNFPLIQSKQKAAVVERWNRSLKQLMFKFFTHKGESYRRYIDVLPDLVNVYNNSVHRTIKMKPSEVTAENSGTVYKNIRNSHRNLLNVGAYVRIVRNKASLEHGYTEKWTREVFKIIKIIDKHPYPLYVLEDLNGTPLQGRFYKQQIQEISIQPKTIVKTIKVRGLGEKIQYYIQTADNNHEWVGKKEYTDRKL